MSSEVDISTRNGAIIVSVKIGMVEQYDVQLGNKIVQRWFHNLAEHEVQRMGKGYMRKREALEAALKVAIDRGLLSE